MRRIWPDPDPDTVLPPLAFTVPSNCYRSPQTTTTTTTIWMIMKETNCRAYWRIHFALLLLLLLLQCCQQAQAIGSIGVGGSIGSGVGGSSSGVAAYGLQCQRIAVSACQGLGYNMTALPNLAGHTNQLEAELQVRQSTCNSLSPSLPFLFLVSYCELIPAWR